MPSEDTLLTIIAGGRDFHDYDALLAAVDAAPWIVGDVVSGGAPGADTLGIRFARETGRFCDIHRAEWGKHGHMAGPIRNTAMAQNAEALIALPGGRGTADMIRKAEAAGLRVYIHRVQP